MAQNRRPGDWDCSFCGFMNFGSRSYCKNCSDGKRPSNNTTNYGNVIRERPGDWYCSVCGFMNFKSRNSCKDCNASKNNASKTISTSSTSKPGDWHCNKCGFLNFKFRKTCKDCNTSRSDSSAIPKKPGDWNCSQCGFLNFKSRTVCKVCATDNYSKTSIRPSIKSKQQQRFRYLIVLDFEATCNEPQNPIPQEVIEWPAMIIDTKNKCILNNYFHFYVKPTIHPKLTNFCSKLTGITQSMVDKGENIINVIKEWNKFCYRNNLLPNNKNEATSCMVTCGDWDLNVLWPMQSDVIKQDNNNEINDESFKLILSCWSREYIHNITPLIQSMIQLYYSDDLLLTPALLHSWINIKDLYKKIYNKRAGGMMKLLNYFGIQHVGRHHCGIDDVRNICNIVLQILNDGVFFDYTFINCNDHGICDDIQIIQNIVPYLETVDGTKTY